MKDRIYWWGAVGFVVLSLVGLARCGKSSSAGSTVQGSVNGMKF